MMCFNTASGKRCCNLIREIKAEEVSAEVSIPQVVSAVATHWLLLVLLALSVASFNTVNGKYCCNVYKHYVHRALLPLVSIP